MKFLSPPILALLATSVLFGCALAPPSHSGDSTKSSSSSGSSKPTGGSGGSSISGSSSSQSATGGKSDPGSKSSSAAAGSSSSQGGSSSASAGASTSGSDSSSSTGGTSSGSNTSRTGGTGGTSGGSGGSSSGGTSSRGGTSSNGGSSSGGASSSSSSSSTSSSSYPQPPKITSGGSNGFTTRYWDCCKPSCAWSANAGGKPCTTCGKDGVATVGKDTQSACNGGGGFMCYWGAPWAVSDTLAFGYAAHNGVPCGTCFQLDFTGKGHYGANAGAQSLSNKTMIVQVINTGGIDNSQFDLLIPGGGVGANNACTAGPSQWGSVDIGAGSGGILAVCKDKACVTQKCQAAFAGKTQLLAGCSWFTDWFNIADNPEMVFKQITCPSEITQRSGEP